MARGAEAYLQMWERAERRPGDGLPRRAPRLHRARARRDRARRGRRARCCAPRRSRSSAGARTWDWCVEGKSGRATGKTVAVLTPEGTVGLAASSARRHVAKGVHAGTRAKRARREDPRVRQGRARPPGGEGLAREARLRHEEQARALRRRRLAGGVEEPRDAALLPEAHRPLAEPDGQRAQPVHAERRVVDRARRRARGPACAAAGRRAPPAARRARGSRRGRSAGRRRRSAAWPGRGRR